MLSIFLRMETDNSQEKKNCEIVKFSAKRLSVSLADGMCRESLQKNASRVRISSPAIPPPNFCMDKFASSRDSAFAQLLVGAKTIAPENMKLPRDGFSISKISFAAVFALFKFGLMKILIGMYFYILRISKNITPILKKNERAFVFAIFLLPSSRVLNLFVGKWI